MAGIIIWVFFGAATGWLASRLLGTEERRGLTTDVLLGVIGALSGGFLMTAITHVGLGGLHIGSILVAAMGAVVLLAVGSLLHHSSAI
jgi:uncharacterized membrane protein YeaQ/YmgE (transglycosylase-associated protein family)